MFARPARDTREKENGRRANILILGQTAGHTYIWARKRMGLNRYDNWKNSTLKIPSIVQDKNKN